MGVVTDAEEHRREAKAAVEVLVKNLSAIVVEQCWGSEEYTDHYRADLRKSLNTALDLRELLG